MPTGTPKKRRELGTYVTRGGQTIEIEHVPDRYTVLLQSKAHLEQLKRVPGAREVQLVGRGVAKVITSPSRRDTSLEHVRRQLFGIGHHAYKPRGREGSVFYISDKILVRFRKDAPVNAALEKFSLGVVREYPDGRTILVQVTTLSGENPVKISNRLELEEYVEWAEPNMVNRFRPCRAPNDNLFPEQWYLEFNNAPQVVKEASINAVGAWDLLRGKLGADKEFGDKKIVVAVIDDGFELSHPDLASGIVSPLDYVDHDNDPSPVFGMHPGSSGVDYHGTPCAGLAIGRTNGTGVVGVAPNCSFMPVRIPMSLDDLAVDDVFRTVARHADVISCSFAPPPVNATQWTKLNETLREIAATGGPRGAGCVVVFGAGNFNGPVNDPNNVRFDWIDTDSAPRTTTGAIVNALAAHPSVISVAACTSLARHAEYSNWGPEVSVCAPSKGEIGHSIVTVDNELAAAGFSPGERYTREFGGTSAATPIVAGAAGLVLSANPDLTAAQVKAVLEETAAKIVDNRPDENGDCRGKAYVGGRCDWFGAGRVDATKAVEKALAQRRT